MNHGDRAESAEDHRLLDRNARCLKKTGVGRVLRQGRNELLRSALAAHADGDVARVLKAAGGNRHTIAAGTGANAAVLAVILDAFEGAARDGDILAGDQFDSRATPALDAD